MGNVKFGRYQLLEKIGQGGTAEVYRAQRTGPQGPEQIVAIKRILPQLSTDTEFINALSAEIRLSAQLQHPNIVQIYDYGYINEIYYIAMEYIHGVNLNDFMFLLADSGKKISVTQSVFIIKSICSALEYAHFLTDFRGRPMELIHRDLNPKNILVSFEGDIKVMDFGITLNENQYLRNVDQEFVRSKITYLTPEQIRSEPLDNRADIFTLGIIFYELITGIKPYMANTDYGILRNIERVDPPPPREIDPSIPFVISNMILRCLSKNREERYFSTAEIRIDLECLEAESGVRCSQTEFRELVESVGASEIANRSFQKPIQSPSMDHASEPESRPSRVHRHKPSNIEQERYIDQTAKSATGLSVPTPDSVPIPGESQSPTVFSQGNASDIPTLKQSTDQDSPVSPTVPSEVDIDELISVDLSQETTDPTPSQSRQPVATGNDTTAMHDEQDDLRATRRRRFNSQFELHPTHSSIWEKIRFSMVILMVLTIAVGGSYLYLGKKSFLRLLGVAVPIFDTVLQISVEPKDAEIELDYVKREGNPIQIGIQWVLNSRHVIKLSHPAYKTGTIILSAPQSDNDDIVLHSSEIPEVKLGKNSAGYSLSVQMIPEYMKVKIDSEPSGAKIYVDATDTGKTTPMEFSFSNGTTAVVRAEKAGFEPIEITYSPDLKKPNTPIRFNFKKPPTPEIKVILGSLAITAPYPVDIYRGKERIASGVTKQTLELPAETLMLRFVNEKYFLDISRKFTILENQVSTFNVDPLGVIILEADPPGCNVSIDGKTIGTAPGQFSLAPGLYNVVFVWETCGDKKSQWVKIISRQTKKSPKVEGCK